jgi:hypothetical protein
MRRQLMREQETLLSYASTPGGRAAAMLGLPPSAPATPTTAGRDRRFGELERATAQLTGQGMDTHATALSELLADLASGPAAGDDGNGARLLVPPSGEASSSQQGVLEAVGAQLSLTATAISQGIDYQGGGGPDSELGRALALAQQELAEGGLAEKIAAQVRWAALQCHALVPRGITVSHPARTYGCGWRSWDRKNVES